MRCEEGCSSWRSRDLHRSPAGSLRRLPVAAFNMGLTSAALALVRWNAECRFMWSGADSQLVHRNFAVSLKHELAARSFAVRTLARLGLEVEAVKPVGRPPAKAWGG